MQSKNLLKITCDSGVEQTPNSVSLWVFGRLGSQDHERASSLQPSWKFSEGCLHDCTTDLTKGLVTQLCKCAYKVDYKKTFIIVAVLYLTTRWHRCTTENQALFKEKAVPPCSVRAKTLSDFPRTGITFPSQNNGPQSHYFCGALLVIWLSNQFVIVSET